MLVDGTGAVRYVRGDRDLEEKFHYILANPERAGLIDPEKGYPWVWTQGDEVQSGKMPDSAGETPTLPESRIDRYYSQRR